MKTVVFFCSFLLNALFSCHAFLDAERGKHILGVAEPPTACLSSVVFVHFSPFVCIYFRAFVHTCRTEGDLICWLFLQDCRTEPQKMPMFKEIFLPHDSLLQHENKGFHLFKVVIFLFFLMNNAIHLRQHCFFLIITFVYSKRFKGFLSGPSPPLIPHSFCTADLNYFLLQWPQWKVLSCCHRSHLHRTSCCSIDLRGPSTRQCMCVFVCV